jgi:hypothetical protein
MPLAQEALETIVRRARSVTFDAETEEEVRRELLARIESWIELAKARPGGSSIVYDPYRAGQAIGLLQQPTGQEWQEFTCPSSLRDVEPDVQLVFDDRGMDEEPGGGSGTVAPGPADGDLDAT